jgi:hypothetical protein
MAPACTTNSADMCRAAGGTLQSDQSVGEWTADCVCGDGVFSPYLDTCGADGVTAFYSHDCPAATPDSACRQTQCDNANGTLDADGECWCYDDPFDPAYFYCDDAQGLEFLDDDVGC